MAATTTRVPNPISARAHSRGGLAAAEALKQAEQALDSLRAVNLDVIDARLAQINNLYGELGAKRKANDLAELYDLALEIIEVSCGLPHSGLEDAARAVCDMVAESRDRQVCDWQAVDVHLAALVLLRSNGQTLKAAERKTLLKALQDVTDKLARTGASPGEVQT